MKLTKGTIPGLLIFEPVLYSDDRGSFMEAYNAERFAGLGFHEVFVQDNESVSRKGVIRALHFQNPPVAQGKLVRVVRGAVMDVAVDIRKGSPWYGQHMSVMLTSGNHLMLWLPAGFAHGFVALEEDTIVHYKCTSVYSSEHEHSIRWDDPDLGIDWKVSQPLVSERDRNASPFVSHKGMFIYHG